MAAHRVCAAVRNRLFWTDFEIIPGSRETLERDRHLNTLVLAPVPDLERLNVVDKGWVLHHDFPGEWPTFIGWRTWDREPRNHKNRERMDSVTVQRWANDGYASQISFWQDQCMLWPAATRIPVHASGPSGPRVISPTEMERAMGFPAG